MKLFFNPASPFARKVLVLAHECELISQLELVPVTLLPTKPAPEVSNANPLGKIPTLLLSDGPLYDSRVIAEFLDSRSAQVHLFPAEGRARWVALRQQAEADGICEAAILMRYEKLLRPPALVFEDWLNAQWTKIAAALDSLEVGTAALEGEMTIGRIAIGCALGYLDLRFADRQWREGRPALADYCTRVSARPSFVATAPPAI